MYLFHLGTGGMTHTLVHLGRSLSVCKSQNRLLVPNQAQPDVGFDEVFDINSNTIVGINTLKVKYQKIIKGLSAYSDPSSKEYTIYNNMGGILTEKDNAFIQKIPTVNNDYVISVGAVGAKDNYFINPVDRMKYYLNISLNEIRLKNNIYKYALRFQQQLPERYIGVHFRNTDYRNDLVTMVEQIRKICKSLNCYNVFIATDCPSSIELFKIKLPNMSIYYNNNIPDPTTLLGSPFQSNTPQTFKNTWDVMKGKTNALHLLEKYTLFKLGLSNQKLVTEFFTDLMCLILSTQFIPSEITSVTHLVNAFRWNTPLFNKFWGLKK